ncbi:ABC transporter ATP-binding protein [Paenibacillus timonensis]|uniref:ABC transporter ATP-binding protein n=1 Tax=Paenibacillus timonensis TaxID=225915 RepID=A0ABW3SHY1_9BACL|nr:MULTISPECIES: ABC transporter ATP-binding protein [Bacillales]MCH1643133.1 ABC transporter ATP-binding protein [Paenibacillus timonensis]
MIKATNLTKQYDNGFVAVDSLNLQVNKGDIYGFLGPNGAGKTTTIRMLNGLIEPSDGSVTIEGKEVKHENASVSKLIGVLPESHGYYNWMTGREYLKLFAELYGVDKKRVKSRVEEVLEWVGMAGKADILIGQYSRGMRQRIGIAKTIVHEPSIIFLDEPTLGLDPQGQKDIQSIITRLNQEQNVTVFITSHLLKEISEICNRVAIVKQGKLLEEGYLDELITGYRLVLKNENPTLEDIFFSLTSDEVGGSI